MQLARVGCLFQRVWRHPLRTSQVPHEDNFVEEAHMRKLSCESKDVKIPFSSVFVGLKLNLEHHEEKQTKGTLNIYENTGAGALFGRFNLSKMECIDLPIRTSVIRLSL